MTSAVAISKSVHHTNNAYLFVCSILSWLKYHKCCCWKAKLSETNSKMAWECFSHTFLQCRPLFALHYYFNDRELLYCILCKVQHHFIEILYTAWKLLAKCCKKNTQHRFIEVSTNFGKALDLREARYVFDIEMVSRLRDIILTGTLFLLAILRTYRRKHGTRL